MVIELRRIVIHGTRIWLKGTGTVSGWYKLSIFCCKSSCHTSVIYSYIYTGV